jgi:hypothetical protein
VCLNENVSARRKLRQHDAALIAETCRAAINGGEFTLKLQGDA